MPSRLPALGLEDFPAAALESSRPVLVLFAAQYCPACRLMEGTLEEFAEAHPEIGVARVDIASPDAPALRSPCTSPCPAPLWLSGSPPG